MCLMILGNFPPRIFGANSVLITVGKPFTYVVQVNDSNGDAVTVSTNIESTVVLNEQTATITATVNNITGFKFSVTAKVRIWE